LAEHAIAEVRRAVAALSPAVLDRLGLAAALRHLTARVARSCAANVRLRMPRQMPRVNEDVQTVVYRLAQECYQNAVRHSGASHVNLSLATADHWLELTIADDGAGFDVAAALRKPDSFGLAGMRERVALMGGTLELHSRPGHGTRVTARLPLEAAAPAREETHVENTSTPGRRSHPVPAGRAKPDRRRARH
jgi:two-component system sensor histidine kinase NreB